MRGTPRRAPAALAVACLLAAFGAACGRADRDAGGKADPRRERIRLFWDQYHSATAARIKGDFGAAAEGYRLALERDPRHEDSLFYLAVSLQETGRYGEAAGVLRRLLAINPEANRAHSQLGALLATLAPGAEPDLDAAAAEFERNREINTEESGPFLRQGLLHLNRGRLSEAREAFRLAAGAGAPEALYLSGLVDYLEGRFPEAARAFLRVLEANEREKAISGRGVFSEGDVSSDPGKQRLTAFERAGIKALLFLYWATARVGGYSGAVPEKFRVHVKDHPGRERRFRMARLPGPVSGRGTWLDADRDGRPDLLVAAKDGVRLYRNTPSGFVDGTDAAGLSGLRDVWDAAAVSGESGPDLYLLRKGYMGAGTNAYLRNEGGRFRDATRERGLTGERRTARVMVADLNGDGREDLLELGAPGPSGQAVRLYVREGARFVLRNRALALPDGAAAVDAVVADFDQDGRSDVFLLGWKTPARLFRRTDAGFEDVTSAAGLAGVGGDGLSALTFDYDRDGRPDLLVTARSSHELSLLRLLSPSLTAARLVPRLFRGAGGGRFEETTAPAGLARPFGVTQAAAADFDGDGFPDLAFALGGLERERLEPSLVLRSDGGRAFTEWTDLPDLDRPANALGLAVADANRDGRPDVFLSGVGLLMLQER